MGQRQASILTLAARRDVLRMLLSFTSAHPGEPPYHLEFTDPDAAVIGACLDHLEHQRGNRPRTRSTRVAVIHSLFGYAALHHPAHAADIARVLAIPSKRHPNDRCSARCRLFGTVC
jgi:integrase/recombinase XerD